MDIIKWRQTYETGIGSMDVQHQKLIDLINALYKMIRNETSNDSIMEILDEMSSYTERHLREEESLLQANDYPDLSNHIDLHHNYREKVKELIAESKNGNETTVKNAYAFLRQWWMKHIVTEDRKYGDFLKSRGVK